MAEQKLNSLRLKYGRAVAIVHALEVDHVNRVLVVGDPDNGCYEWALEKNSAIQLHSDVAYGSPEVALRDGLIAFYGLPDAESLETLKAHAKRAL